MDKLRKWCREKLTRENMIVLALSGILLMVIALPSGRSEKEGDGEPKSGLSDSQAGIMEERERTGTDEE